MLAAARATHGRPDDVASREGRPRITRRRLVQGFGFAGRQLQRPLCPPSRRSAHHRTHRKVWRRAPCRLSSQDTVRGVASSHTHSPRRHALPAALGLIRLLPRGSPQVAQPDGAAAAMFCAISGNTPEHPVVSKTGHLFEQSVIEKYIESTGKCPVTGEVLSADDLLPLKVSSTVKPRPVAASSIPGMLTLFQNEWDALMLETFTLKQQLETARQELGQALYQHDAACRVIARLIKERDDARQALAEARPSVGAVPAASAAPAAPAAGAMEVDGASGMTPVVVGRFEANAKGLSKGRKKRQPPADQTTAEAIASFSALGSAKAHSKGHTCVDVHASEPLAATGGADGHVSLYDCATGTAKATLKGHTKKVHGVSLHPTKPIVLSCSADKTARCWNTDGEQLHVLSTHSGPVTACTLHSTGDYAVTASADKSWALHDLETGSSVFVVGNGTAGASRPARTSCGATRQRALPHMPAHARTAHCTRLAPRATRALASVRLLLRRLPSGRPHPGHRNGGRRADLGREVTGHGGRARRAPGGNLLPGLF